jgi:glutamine amidotransferase
VGWNDVVVKRRQPLFERTGESPAFYFDHSFHFQCEARYQAAVCDYGGPVTAAVQHENLFGVQFHPEKSQASGLKLLRGLFVTIGG